MRAAGWRSFQFTVPVYPMAISRLFELPDGRVAGTAGSYEGNFIFDPKTGRAEHLGKIQLSHYATAQHAGKVYLSGYPSAPVYEWDPTRPWTAGKRITGTQVMADDNPQANPRRLSYLKQTGAHKMYSAAVATGKVYFGGRWYRNGSAGGLGWWDFARQQAGGFWQPFSNYQINFITAANDGQRLVISAHRIEDTLLNKPKPDQGALFFLDTATDKLIGEKLEPVANAKGPGPIVGVAGNRVIGWTEDPAAPQRSILYGVDVAAQRIVWRKSLPVPLPIKIGSNQTEPWDYRLGPDGQIWTFLDAHTLVRIDPKDATVQVVGKLHTGGQLAFIDHDIYLGSTESIRRCRRLEPITN